MFRVRLSSPPSPVLFSSGKHGLLCSPARRVNGRPPWRRQDRRFVGPAGPQTRGCPPPHRKQPSSLRLRAGELLDRSSESPEAVRSAQPLVPLRLAGSRRLSASNPSASQRASAPHSRSPGRLWRPGCGCGLAPQHQVCNSVQFASTSIASSVRPLTAAAWRRCLGSAPGASHRALAMPSRKRRRAARRRPAQGGRESSPRTPVRP